MAENVQPYTWASVEGQVFWFLDTLTFAKATGEQIEIPGSPPD